MRNFGLLTGFGLLTAVVTGGIATYIVQPMIMANIAFGANTWIVAWLIAGVVGYAAAIVVWAIVVSILMMTVLTEWDDI